MIVIGFSPLHILLQSAPTQIGVAEDRRRHDQEADELRRGKEPLENETSIYISSKELQEKAEDEQQLFEVVEALRRKTKAEGTELPKITTKHLGRIKNALNTLQEILMAAEPPDAEAQRALTVLQRLKIAERESYLFTQ